MEVSLDSIGIIASLVVCLSVVVFFLVLQHFKIKKITRGPRELTPIPVEVDKGWKGDVTAARKRQTNVSIEKMVRESIDRLLTNETVEEIRKEIEKIHDFRVLTELVSQERLGENRPEVMEHAESYLKKFDGKVMGVSLVSEDLKEEEEDADSADS